MSDLISTMELSIRRKPGLQGLPGDDVSEHNLKIGSSIKGRAPLSGLTKEEEKIYLPEIIGVASDNQEWGLRVNNYWNNISEKVPADGTTTDLLQGRVLRFTLKFPDRKTKDAYDNAIDFSAKGKISASEGVICIEGVADFVLFRYCLVYGRVANSIHDIAKSPRILFYLYSKSTETKIAHNTMKEKLAATNKFSELIAQPAIVDAILRMFKQLPEAFENDEAKHMALFGFAESSPKDFLNYANDSGLRIKSAILHAVEKGIIYSPANTDSYYYGENQEVLLGSSLNDVVIWWKTHNEDRDSAIKETIKALLKEDAQHA